MSKLQQDLAELHKKYDEAKHIVGSCARSLDIKMKTEIDIEAIHSTFHKLLNAFDILGAANHNLFGTLISLPKETDEEIIERLGKEND